MKKILFALPLLLLLTGCPIGLDYAPGTIGTEAVNVNLAGTWTLDPSTPDHEVVQVTFKKLNKYAYAVTVDEAGELYSMETKEFTMYQTTIDGLNILYLKPSDENKYYLYQVELDGTKQMIIGDVSLLDGGVDAITSTQSLRDQIAASKSREQFLAIPKYVFNKK